MNNIFKTHLSKYQSIILKYLDTYGQKFDHFWDGIQVKMVEL